MNKEKLDKDWKDFGNTLAVLILLKLVSAGLVDSIPLGAFLFSLIPPLVGVPVAAVYFSRLSGKRANGWYGLFNFLWLGFLGPIICYVIGKKFYKDSLQRLSTK